MMSLLEPALKTPEHITKLWNQLTLETKTKDYGPTCIRKDSIDSSEGKINYETGIPQISAENATVFKIEEPIQQKKQSKIESSVEDTLEASESVDSKKKVIKKAQKKGSCQKKAPKEQK